MKTERNPSCPTCGGTMFWDEKKRVWYCIMTDHKKPSSHA